MSIRPHWQKALVVAVSFAVLSLVACGGGGPPSGIKQRAFVSDDFDGTLHIINADDDLESFSRISTGSQPGLMTLSPDKTLTLVFDAGDVSLAVVSNITEAVLGRIVMPNVSTSYVSLSDNSVGFVAISNSNISPCIPRCVEVVDVFTTFAITNTVNVVNAATAPLPLPPLNAATTLVLSPSEGKLLVFGGPAEHVDTMVVIDTGLAQTSPGTAATQFGSTDCTNAGLPANCFDRPVWAVFSSDGNTAYVMNCGPECGGTVAGVTVLNTGASPAVPIQYIPFPATAGATIGLLSGNNLFVAGTPSGKTGAFAGTLSVLNTTALASPTSSVAISDGYHSLMQLGSNNKLFIGAGPTCTAGCLTIFPSTTDSNTAVVDSNTGNVTGIAPIGTRNVVYVVEDLVAGSFQGIGELRIYDTTTDALTPTLDQIDIVGKAVDVKYIP